ncbi:hypothetical protein D3C76_402380 [compost metagenome]
MGHADPGLVVIVHLQCLAIEPCTLAVVGHLTGLVDQRLEFRVAPACVVLAIFRRLATEQRGEEIVRVAVVACPACGNQVGLAFFGPAQHLCPLHDANVELDADLGQVGLEHFRRQPWVGVGRATAAAGEQGDDRTVWHTGLFEQRTCLVEVARWVLVVAVEADHARRIGVDADHGIAFAEQLVDVGLAVEGHVDGFAHTHIAEVFVFGVHGDVAGDQCFGIGHLELGVGLDRRHVLRLGVQRHLAFVGAQLLQAYVAVVGDGENQGIGRWLATEIVRVGLVAYLGVLVVALEDERAGADRLAVQLGGFTGLEQLVAVLGGVDRGEAHGHVAQKRCFRAGQGDDHGAIVGLVHRLEQFAKGHAFEIWVADAGLVVPGVLRVELAAQAPQHVIGIEVAGRGEVVGGVELHPLAQVEGVGQAIG